MNEIKTPEYVILPSPVKIGDRERVASYAATLTEGQEQLLIGRDCSLFITDGKGGYLEFKTLNSGMTREEIEHAIEEIQSEYTEGFNSLSEDYTKHKEDNDKLFKELNLKFEKYVTTEELDKIKELATHSNRETLDKFSEDDEGNPLYNNKKIVADFDTSEIEEKIADLKLRTHIGKELDNLYLTLPEEQTTNLVTNGIINFSNKISGNMEITGNKILCKAHRKYHLLAGICTSSTGYCRFGVYNENTQSFTGRYANAISIDYNGIAGNQVLNDYLEFNEDTYITIRIVLISNTTKIDNLQSNLYIQEINRQVILDPAEDAKNKEFDYGYFENYENYQFKTGVDFPFKVKKSNLELSDNGYPILKKNKSYSITISLQLYSSGRYTCRFYDNLTSSILSDNYIDIESSNASTTQSIIIKPESDIEFCLNGLANASGYLRYSSLIIEEIAHPYYFNYFKDSLSSKVLFEGEASATGEYELLDDITNYEWLVVYGCTLYSGAEYVATNSLKIKVSDIVFKDNDSSSKQNFPLIIPYTGNLNNTLINLDFNNQNHFNILFNNNITTYNKIIYKIEGIGFNYDNPYKDLISSGGNVDIDEFEFTDEEIENNLAGIWGDK